MNTQQDYLEIENFLSPLETRNILQIITRKQLAWHYMKKFAYGNDAIEKLILGNNDFVIETDGFTMHLYDENVSPEENKTYATEYENVFKFVKKKIEKLFGKPIKDVYRLKVNFTYPYPDSIKYKCGLPHVDRYEKHSTILIYLTESDGETFIFDTLHDPNIDRDIQVAKQHKIINQVSPSPGKALIFRNGFRYHAQGINTFGKRFVININFSCEE